MSFLNVTLLLVDDHATFRDALRALLHRETGFSVVGEAAEGRSAVRLAKALSPTIVLMDVRMPSLNGVEATRQVLSACPSSRVLGLAAQFDAQIAGAMRTAGACGLIAKDSAFEELVNAIRAVLQGEQYVSPSLAHLLSVPPARSSGVHRPAWAPLTPREREIVQLYAEGNSTKQIAQQLKLSEKTVETHRRNLFDKLQFDNIARLTKYAIREGITEL